MKDRPLSFKEKCVACPWGLVALVGGLSLIGIVMLYGAAGGSFLPWCGPQMMRLIIGLVAMMTLMVMPPEWFIRSAYGIYGGCLGLLILVEIMGHIGMGAQRWLNLGLFQLQPSELMRFSLIVALACYFHRRSFDDVARPENLLAPLGMILVPGFLILRQPDLGTALTLTASGVMVLVGAGIPKRYLVGAFLTLTAAAPLLWTRLHEYQKKRILTFLNPEGDRHSAGYHIFQSKIALGSGGAFGKGFQKGTQSHLDFLPEKQTDCIFTMFGEEFGFAGSLVLLGLFFWLIVWGFMISLRCHSVFTRLVALGVTGTIFLYVVINMGMVMGLLPVVGVPLPFISYGGTALVTLMMGIGLLLNASIHHDQRLRRYYRALFHKSK